LRTDRIRLGHGAGGKLGQELVEKILLPEFDNAVLAALDDGAWVRGEERVCVTTDSFVVKPIFFPGGDIGSLAVYGTVNDLAVMGAKPVALCCAFMIEEGLKLSVFREIVHSIAEASKRLGLPIVAGDTKVVERGATDQLFVTTTGIGIPMANCRLEYSRIEPGDAVVITGTIAEHGTAVMLARSGFEFRTEIESDCAPILSLVDAALRCGADVRFMRDPTRGGVATVLNEIAQRSQTAIRLDEASIPIRSDVSAALELLGLDPLYVASEGRCVVIVAESDAEKLVAALQREEQGKDAAIIGRVHAEPPGLVWLKSSVGGERILPMLTAEQLPRIC